jgi:hypothetical protein
MEEAVGEPHSNGPYLGAIKPSYRRSEIDYRFVFASSARRPHSFVDLAPVQLYWEAEAVSPGTTLTPKPRVGAFS